MPSNYPGRYSPDPRRRRRPGRSLSGVVVPPAPTVTTIAINAINSTTANVIGSVNPNGLDTISWVSYGLALPLPSGVTTAPVSVGSGTSVITTSTTLINLASSQTYYVAVVGQSAGGTTYGQTLSFVTPSSATQPIVPFGQPSATIPHFNMPFSLQFRNSVPQGISVVEQDTTEEVVANVAVVVSCAIGACPQIPSFGRPDPTFAQEPVDTTELVAAIQRWEPRATIDAISALQLDGTSWGITLETSTTAAGNI